MVSHSGVLHGIVRGKTIELERDPGIPTGRRVSIIVQPDSPMEAGDELRKSFGSWSDDPEGLEQFLKWNREQRKRGRGRLEP